MQGGNVLAWPQNKCEKMNKNLQKKGQKCSNFERKCAKITPKMQKLPVWHVGPKHQEERKLRKDLEHWIYLVIGS